MRKNILAVSTFLLVFALLFHIGWCSAKHVSAQGRPLTAAERKLALRVARTAAHEGALKNLRDVDLIWQVTESRASTTEKRSEFLALHSGRAIGHKPCRTDDGNCWSQTLDRRGTIPASVAVGDAGYWRTVAIPAWQRVLQRAEALISGDVISRPCPVAPYTWGGVGRAPDGADDRQHAALDGLYPIGCSGTLNDGFAFKPRAAVR